MNRLTNTIVIGTVLVLTGMCVSASMAQTATVRVDELNSQAAETANQKSTSQL